MSDTQNGRKLGLALSGGGFRAAFFHIGVLAQMARLGMLRHVEVISTVSGGSIVGTVYYLHVKRLLEAKADDEIRDQDYQAIIQQIERDFLAAVQRNLRMRTFLNPLKTIRMALANYSRSDRIGELYDRYFYRPVLKSKQPSMIEMRKLKIQPKGAKKDFYPLTDNADRKAKVPILLINATTLNTGHNWRFEASRMGEPARGSELAQEIDKNLRLRRPPSYEDIIKKQQNIELGLAVAASACVPGIFHPLAISDLYPRDIRVQLVDGGVHDNLGVQGLLDLECQLFVVSDASGQMEDEPDPTTRIGAVLGRASSILMDRLREEQLFRLMENANRPVAFMHLRKGLTAEAVTWRGPDGQPASSQAVTKKERTPKTPSESFGVAQDVQSLLSRIRTDLDSFTEVEAFSLLLDAYQMSHAEFARLFKQDERLRSRMLDPAKAPEFTWSRAQEDIQKIQRCLAKPTNQYRRQLEVASQILFKIFRLCPPLTWAVIVLGLALLGLIFTSSWIHWELSIELKAAGGQEDPTLFTTSIRTLLLGIILLLLTISAPRLSRAFKALKFLRTPSESLARVIVRAILPALASLFVWIHLKVFDRLFLWQGRIARLK